MSEWLKTPHYFPVDDKGFSFKAGLFAWGTSFGQGSWDQKYFQITEDFETYRRNKKEGRKESLGKYYCQSGVTAESKVQYCRWMIETLLSEYPEWFELTVDKGHQSLYCHHTKERLIFTSDAELVSQTAKTEYQDLLDALMNQVPEDLALVETRGDSNCLSLLHLFSPSHWAAEDKVGRDFNTVHSPIPHSEKLRAASGAFVKAMIQKGPFVRFAWSLVTDQRLNHNPYPPPGTDPKTWNKRSFDPKAKSPFYLRVERQITHGFPMDDFAAFLIRVHFVPASALAASPDWVSKLLINIESMDEQTAQYKGVTDIRADLEQWLRSHLISPSSEAPSPSIDLL